MASSSYLKSLRSGKVKEKNTLVNRKNAVNKISNAIDNDINSCINNT